MAELPPRPGQAYLGKRIAPTAEAVDHARRTLQENTSAAAALADSLKPGIELDLMFAFNVLSTMEHQLSELCQGLGIELDTATDRQNRYAALRAANLRIQALEREAGAEVDGTKAALFLKALGAKLEHWWGMQGFGYISKMQFDRQGGVIVEFSCELRSESSLALRGPGLPSAERLRQNLAERGFKWAGEDGDGPPTYLQECDASHQALATLFEEYFPDARPMSSAVRFTRKRAALLSATTFYFEALHSIAALPLPPAR